MTKVAEWQKCERPEDCGPWITPPTCQGQIVEVSYAESRVDGTIYMRVRDRSDNTAEYHARPLGDDESFEPWNVEPE